MISLARGKEAKGTRVAIEANPLANSLLVQKGGTLLQRDNLAIVRTRSGSNSQEKRPEQHRRTTALQMPATGPSPPHQQPTQPKLRIA